MERAIKTRIIKRGNYPLSLTKDDRFRRGGDDEIFDGTGTGIYPKPDKLPILNPGEPLRQSPVKLSILVIRSLKG